MLVEFRAKNFRSIKEEIVLSLTASKHKELEKNCFESASLKLLKSSAIYGPNASGKSNILKALSAMKKIVLLSASKFTEGTHIPLTPFLFSSQYIDKPTEFEITFIRKGIRYQFGFVADKKRVYEEWLFVFETNRAQTWYTREYIPEKDDYAWYFGSKFKGEKNLWKNSTRSNALFLSTAVQLNSEQLKPVFNWFLNKLQIVGVFGWSPEFTIDLLQKDKYKDKIIRFLKIADFDIEDVNVKFDDFSPDKLPKDLPLELKEKMIEEFGGKKIIEEFNTVHLNDEGEKVLLDFNEESDGTQKFFSILGPCLDTLDNGNVLFVDELNDNLHPLLVEFIVKLFHNEKMNRKGAQIIFTTHETSILSQSIFRRDQVWFCEKEKQATKLYSLLEFKPRKGVEDIEKGYLSGRYGALPYIKSLYGVLD